MRHITLHNGVVIPVVGLGTFRAKDDEAYAATLHALKSGYRHIDTAAIYQNEDAVGRAIKDSGIEREALFITSKLWNTEQGYDQAKEALQASLDRLGLTYLDLYLIHWPKTYALAAESWKAFEEMYTAGLLKAIGVSNFTFHHLEHLFETSTILPMVNQVETHLAVQNQKLYDFCLARGIYLQAYAPLMSHEIKTLLNNETLQDMAQKKGCTVAQIALKYQVDRDIIVLPKSVHPRHIEENIQIFDITLSDDETAILKAMNNGRKFFPDPDNIAF